MGSEGWGWIRYETMEGGLVDFTWNWMCRNDMVNGMFEWASLEEP
jgi:hypothetical protein